ncbi:MAG: helix-turn-helix transcriptional regulator [Pseudomonadota bacterium]
MITEEGRRAFEQLGLKTQARTLDMVSQGVRQMEIAHKLGISSETVKQHLQRSRTVLSVPNTVALAAIVVQRGWVRVEDPPQI